MELVLDCVMPYIRDNDVLNSVSLVSKKFFDIDSKTRKRLTVHVPYLLNPSRLSLRFPNIESLTLKSYACGRSAAHLCCIPVTPWIQEISVNFTRLNTLHIRNMVVSPDDLKHLAKNRGANLRNLDISGCKMFSEDGLVDIARYCIDLRILHLHYNSLDNDNKPNGKWLHELASCNTVMESLSVLKPFGMYDMEDITRLAKICSNSLKSLNIFPRFYLDAFSEVFKHAKNLDRFGYGITKKDRDYSGFKFPPNIRALSIELRGASFPFLLPYLNQLRELELYYGDIEHNCQCSLFEKCPNLEVLYTQCKCGDNGLQVFGQFCKKLHTLGYGGHVTKMGLIALAQGCPNLVDLEVTLLDISNEALECVGTHLKNLRDFHIILGKEDIIADLPLDKGVRDMLVGCSKLENLDIDLCLAGLTDVGLGYIGKYGHNLRSLSLSCTGVSDVGLLELSKGCPKLRKLKLRGCPFSEQAIASLVFKINQSVRYVWVDHGSDNVLALTRPMVSAEVLTKLYVKLAEKLHRLALRLVADGSVAGSVKITYTSSRAIDDIDTPLLRNLVASSIQNEEQDTLGGSSGKPLEIIVRIANVESRFTTAVSEFGDIKWRGRVKDGVPHLTKVGAFEVDVSLEANIILCRHVDQGNTISRATSKLVEENVNQTENSFIEKKPRDSFSELAVSVLADNGSHGCHNGPSSSQVNTLPKLIFAKWTYLEEFQHDIEWLAI